MPCGSVASNVEAPTRRYANLESGSLTLSDDTASTPVGRKRAVFWLPLPPHPAPWTAIPFSQVRSTPTVVICPAEKPAASRAASCCAHVTSPAAQVPTIGPVISVAVALGDVTTGDGVASSDAAGGGGPTLG